MEMNYMELITMKSICIQKMDGNTLSDFSDMLSIEEPLEIRLNYGPENNRIQKSISVTMRTPGNDVELAIGFLFTEGIISSFKNVKTAYHKETNCLSQKQNIVQIDLDENFTPNLMQTDRNFYTTSSCGVCGKSSIQSIKTVSSFKDLAKPIITVNINTFYQLPKKLILAQNDFTSTGGLHACGIFSTESNLIFLSEDVGRHNALDKLIGKALIQNKLPLNQHILLLSGRASFELIQKAAMAGISVIASIGAPSSLAVELAQEFNITLLGFLKEGRFNLYNSSDSVVINRI